MQPHLSRNMHRLRLLQIERTLQQPVSKIERPAQGWVRTLRTVLNMSQIQLAKRLGITQQSVQKLEVAEKDGSITVARLERAADALGFRLVYVLLPKQEATLDAHLRAAAHRAAERLTDRVDRTMSLEDQGRSEAARHADLKELEDHLYRSFSPEIWSVEENTGSVY